MKIRTQTILLEVGVFFAGLFTLGVGAFLVEISHDVAWDNPTITYMRVPVLLIAWAFLAFVLFFYTRANVGGSITNLYVILGVVALILIGIFFYLIAALFQKAVDYKQEVDLTV